MTFSAAEIVRSANSRRSSVDCGVALELDFVAGALQHGFLLLQGLRPAFFLEALGNLLRLRDDVLAFATGRIDLRLGQSLGLGGLLAATVGRAETFLDARPSLIQHLQDRLVDEQAQHEQQEREVHQLASSTGRLMPRSVIPRNTMPSL